MPLVHLWFTDNGTWRGQQSYVPIWKMNKYKWIRSTKASYSIWLWISVSTLSVMFGSISLGCLLLCAHCEGQRRSESPSTRPAWALFNLLSRNFGAAPVIVTLQELMRPVNRSHSWRTTKRKDKDMLDDTSRNPLQNPRKENTSLICQLTETLLSFFLIPTNFQHISKYVLCLNWHFCDAFKVKGDVQWVALKVHFVFIAEHKSRNI